MPCLPLTCEGGVVMNNDELKIKVNELRNEGYGYKKIATELSISVSAARYMCIKTTEEGLLTDNCEHCGLAIKSIKGKKKKRFCSDRCRWQWWNQKRREDKHHESH